MENKDLLSELAERQGCKYLSDLKYQDDRLYDCCLDLLNSKAEKFTLWEWEECVCYLMGKEVNVNSFEEVRRLLNQLKQPNVETQNTRERREYDEK